MGKGYSFEQVRNHEDVFMSEDQIKMSAKREAEFKAEELEALKMKFPSGNEYLQHKDYWSAVWKHLFSGTPLEDILSADELLLTIGKDSDNTADVLWLELADRYYPERLNDFLSKYEEMVAIRAMENEICGDAFQKDASAFFENMWFYFLDPEVIKSRQKANPEDKCLPYSKNIKKKVTDILLKYAPTIGTKNTKITQSSEERKLTWQLDDYLPTEELQNEHAEILPEIGSGLVRIHKQFESDPAQALISVLGHLPSYNAGKKAYYIGKFVNKYKESLDKNLLIATVKSNKNIGSFDKNPFINVIEEAYKE